MEKKTLNPRLLAKMENKYKECVDYIKTYEHEEKRKITATFCYDYETLKKKIFTILYQKNILTHVGNQSKNYPSIPLFNQQFIFGMNDIGVNENLILCGLNIYDNIYCVACTFESKIRSSYLFRIHIYDNLLLKYGYRDVYDECKNLLEIAPHRISPQIYYNYYYNGVCIYMYEDITVNYISLEEYMRSVDGKIELVYEHNLILLLDIMTKNRFTNKSVKDLKDVNDILRDVYVDPHNHQNMFKIKDFTKCIHYDEYEGDLLDNYILYYCKDINYNGDKSVFINVKRYITNIK